MTENTATVSAEVVPESAGPDGIEKNTKVVKMEKYFDQSTQSYAFKPKVPGIDRNNVIKEDGTTSMRPSGAKASRKRAVKLLTQQGFIKRRPVTVEDERAKEKRIEKRRNRNKMAANSRRANR